MKISFTILFILAIQLMTACGHKHVFDQSNNDSSKLISLERKWLEAEFALDTAYLSSIMDNRFMGISEEGVKNKTEDLLSMYNNITQRIKDSVILDSFRLEDPLVKVYENTAVVTFVVHSYGRNKNVPRERRTRFYDVWIRSEEGWKAVASQGTPLQ